MAQGNITKKDKVNIPDWVGTNLYLENDFVINDNKFYRANGDIPAGATTLTIGTAGATWTEMSPSAAASTLPWCVINTRKTTDDGVPSKHPLDISRGVGFIHDSVLDGISLDADHDHVPFISFNISAYVHGDGENQRGITVAIAYTDNDTDNFTYESNASITRFLSNASSVNWGMLEAGFSNIVNVPGRKFYLIFNSSAFTTEYRIDASATGQSKNMILGPSVTTTTAVVTGLGNITFRGHY